MSKVLALCSGGLDSSVMLFIYQRICGPENVYALNMYYGQRNKKEQECLRWQAEHYWDSEDIKTHLIVRDVSQVFEFCKDTHPMFEGSSAATPEGTYEEQLQGEKIVSTYVPFRNGLFISYAAAIAYELGCDLIACAVHADDAGAAYPDCTERFINAMSEAVERGTGKAVKLVAPFVNQHKDYIVQQGKSWGMTQEEFNHTWSCYAAGDQPCGKCATCLDRKKAFEGTGFNPW